MEDRWREGGGGTIKEDKEIGILVAYMSMMRGDVRLQLLIIVYWFIC